VKVSWDDDIPNCFWKVIKFHGSSHHQPAIVYDSFGDFGDFLYGIHPSTMGRFSWLEMARNPLVKHGWNIPTDRMKTANFDCPVTGWKSQPGASWGNPQLSFSTCLILQGGAP